MNGRVRIITDSVADIPRELVAQFGIKVVPIYVLVGGKSYCDNGSLDRGWFYTQLTQSHVLPSTAAPPPEEFLAAYQELVTEGAEEIIGLFLSGNLSSIDDNALLAARQLEGARVHIIESGQVSMGIGWQVIAAAEAAAQGQTVAEIKKLIYSIRSRTLVFGVLDSLEYLRRGGRVNWATAWLGDLLHIKPLIAFESGEARLIGRVRTHRRALQGLAKRMSEKSSFERIAFLHSCVDTTVVDQFRDLLRDYLPPGPKPVVQVTPVFATHTGPGGVGVAVVFSEDVLDF
ncbi:MAG: DegV family protein [Anaerolineae bacterium]|nr:DegV family protein [Anaerolineae bacterium]